MSQDGRHPFGIPVFWPFSNQYFVFPCPILPPLMHSELDDATMGQFPHEAFSVHNLYVFFLEFAETMPFILILGLFYLKRMISC